MNDSVQPKAVPFGHSISTEDIEDTLSLFDGWEERYRYIIELGKELPGLPDELKNEEHLIRGCQSQVWIKDWIDGDRIQLAMDSDAFIVKGLLGVVLAAYNNKTAQEILAFDIDAYFESLELMNHLSATRGNGLRAMVARIRDIASRAC